MCGIIGIVARRNIGAALFEDMQHFAYRGSDAAGMAGLYEGRLAVRKEAALVAATRQLHGTFAFALLTTHTPDTLWCARQENPLVLGVGAATTPWPPMSMPLPTTPVRPCCCLTALMPSYAQKGVCLCATEHARASLSKQFCTPHRNISSIYSWRAMP
jgi:hypothetical protein